MFRKSDDRFPNGISWDDIPSQKLYLLQNRQKNDIIYEPVETKGEIEMFAESSKATLEPYGKVTMIGGDFDWIDNNKTIASSDVRENNRKAVERCEPGSLRAVFPYSRINKQDKTLQNAEDLQDLGVQVKIRDWDEAVRGIVVEQRNERNDLVSADACFWYRPAMSKSYVIEPGYPQVESKKRKEMETHGWKMTMQGNEAGMRSKVLIPAMNYANNMWANPRLRTIDDIITNQQVLHEVKKIENSFNGNNLNLHNME